jgi:hypothetical protein
METIINESISFFIIAVVVVVLAVVTHKLQNKKQ